MSAVPEPNPGAHLPLHPLEFQVLLVLLDGDLHGYGIAKAIEDKDTKLGPIYPTNLYRRLRDMVQAGLITEHRSEAESGNRRSTFTITKLGHQVAVEEAHRLENMVVDARRYRLLANKSGDR